MLSTKEAVLLCDICDRFQEYYAGHSKASDRDVSLEYRHLSEKMYELVEAALLAEGLDADQRASLESYFHGLDIPVTRKLATLESPDHPELEL